MAQQGILCSPCRGFVSKNPVQGLAEEKAHRRALTLAGLLQNIFAPHATGKIHSRGQTGNARKDSNLVLTTV